MQDIIDFLGTISSLFTNFIEMIFNLIESLISLISNALSFILAVFTELPSIITGSMFSNLPFVFQYGISAIFGVMLLILVMKLFALFKFW